MNQEKLKQLFTDSLPQKVKLQLIQPDIICSGRDRVTATFRGEAVSKRHSFRKGMSVGIKFKYKGEEILAQMYSDGHFREPFLADIVLK